MPLMNFSSAYCVWAEGLDGRVGSVDDSRAAAAVTVDKNIGLGERSLRVSANGETSGNDIVEPAR